jgi:hypothetical protein
MKSVDHRSRSAADARSGSENLSPCRTVHRSTGSEINLTPLDGIEGLSQKAEWSALSTCNIRNLNRHSAPDNTIRGIERLDGLRKELVPAVFPIENIADYGGKQFLLDELEQL